MIACYDLSRCPPTYDAVAFLALAEGERRRRGEDYIHVRILPGPADGFRADSLWPHTLEARALVRDRVLVPLCRLLPSVRSVEVSPTRRHVGEWGHGEYYVGLPRILEALRAGLRPLRAVVARSHASGLITFTLREAEHWPLRNSRTAEWAAAARELSARGWNVIVLRDAARAAEVLEGCRTSSLHATDLSSRANLYARAALNVGVCNGPMWMSIFMGAPTLMMRPTTNAAGGCYDESFYSRHGLSRGAQLPSSPPHQRLCWEDDTYDNIMRAVREFLGNV